MKAWDVVVVGGINTDYLVRGWDLPCRGGSLDGQEFLEAPGGKGANAAVTASRLGARTAIIGRVGNDDRGRALIARLADEDVRVAHIGLDDGVPTGAAVIHVDRKGQRQILAAPGANLRLSVAHVAAAADMIRASRVLVAQLEVPVQCVEAAVRIAADAGVRVVLDPAPPHALSDDVLQHVELIRANASEAEVLSGVEVGNLASARHGARELLGRGVRTVIVGSEGGNLVLWRTGEEWIPELPVERVDATGAGDAFAGGLAVALAEWQNLPDAARLATVVAALSTTALGAQTALPDRHAVERYLERLTGTHAHST